MGAARKAFGGALRAYLYLVVFMFASGVLGGAWLALAAQDQGMELSVDGELAGGH